MARVKKANEAPPPPKHWSEVKHGCCSCVHYRLEIRAYPCHLCEGFNFWEDASPDTPRVPQYMPAPSIPAQDEPVLAQPEDAPKTTKSRSRKTAVIAEEPASMPVEPASASKRRPGRPKKVVSVEETPETLPEPPMETPKKRPGRPRKTAAVAETTDVQPEAPAAEPKKRVGRSKKSESKQDLQPSSTDIDQLSLLAE